MPGIRRPRPAADEDVVVTQCVFNKTGIRVFCSWHDPVTGAKTRDDSGQGTLYTWAQAVTELNQATVDKLRRLPYKLMGATNNEADAAIAPE